MSPAKFARACSDNSSNAGASTQTRSRNSQNGIFGRPIAKKCGVLHARLILKLSPPSRRSRNIAKATIKTPSTPQPEARFTQQKLATVGLLAIYAILLLISLNRTPLWLDEIQQLGNAWSRPLPELIRWTEMSPGAVPLPFLIQQVSVQVLGRNEFAARVPAALFSVLAGVVFAAILQFLNVRRRAVVLGIFLLLPLQFRYAIEARGYSQGLFFSVLALYLFLRFLQTPSVGILAGWGIAVALGLYSQAFTIVPAMGGLAFLLVRRTEIRWKVAAGATAAAALCVYAPWYLVSTRTRATVSETVPFSFSFTQVRPLVLLHDMTGGGYLCAISLLALIALGWRAHRTAWQPAFLVTVAIIALAGPVAIDAASGYFFANRQFLFAMPALVLLSAPAIDRGWRTLPLLAVFAVAAAITDWRYATVPKDDLLPAADAIAVQLDNDSCVITAPAPELAHYEFFRPEIRRYECGAPVTSSKVISVFNKPYAREESRQELVQKLQPGYKLEREWSAGSIVIGVYRQIGR